MRPITPENPVDDIANINPQNFKTDPLLPKYRGEQHHFDKCLAVLLENEKHNVHTTVHKNMDSPISVSILFGTNRPATNLTSHTISPA